MAERRHRWEMSLSEPHIVLLKEAAKQFRIAWKHDMEHPDRYPLDTHYVFSHAKERLRGRRPHWISTMPPPRKPRRLSDIVSDREIKAVYEDHNRGSYEEALEASQRDDPEAIAAFSKILRAMKRAFLAGLFSPEFLPRPKVHFLHRELLEIADVAGIGDLKDEGLAEFLDDLCPCGKTHSKDSVRKLRERLPRKQRKQGSFRKR